MHTNHIPWKTSGMETTKSNEGAAQILTGLQDNFQTAMGLDSDSDEESGDSVTNTIQGHIKVVKPLRDERSKIELEAMRPHTFSEGDRHKPLDNTTNGNDDRDVIGSNVHRIKMSSLKANDEIHGNVVPTDRSSRISLVQKRETVFHSH